MNGYLSGSSGTLCRQPCNKASHATRPATERRLMYYEDSVIEQSTEQKLLWHLLPLLCLLSTAGMLNCLSLGYAAPAMGPALDVSATQFGVADALFCIGYLLAALPAAWLLLRIGPRRWIAGLAVATGSIAVAHALVWDAGSLYALHLMLGVSTAGLFSAMVFYLTRWMPPRHRTKAIPALIAAAVLVPVFGGAASEFLLWVAQLFPVSGWRFLLLVEGVPTLWLGLHTPARTPEDPAEVSWLPPSERHWLLDQLRQVAPRATASRFADGLRNPKLRKLGAIQVVVGLVGGSLGMWVPLSMQQRGYVPPSIGGAIMAVAAAVGVAGAVAVGLLWQERAQWQKALRIALALAGLCLAVAAVLPFGFVAVPMLSVVAAITPGILALIWVLAPWFVAGAAAAAGFAALSMAGMFGYFAAAGLVALRLNPSGRCLILAVVCLVAAWFATGLAGGHEPDLTTSAASPGA
jgi:MFS family permease